MHQSCAQIAGSRCASSQDLIAAKLIVEAVRRSKDASPEGVRRGLEMMGKYDLGGYVVDFSPAKHWGSQFVELSLIGGSGRLVY